MGKRSLKFFRKHEARLKKHGIHVQTDEEIVMYKLKRKMDWKDKKPVIIHKILLIVITIALFGGALGIREHMAMDLRNELEEQKELALLELPVYSGKVVDVDYGRYNLIYLYAIIRLEDGRSFALEFNYDTNKLPEIIHNRTYNFWLIPTDSGFLLRDGEQDIVSPENLPMWDDAKIEEVIP